MGGPPKPGTPGQTIRALAARAIAVWLRAQRDRYRADSRAIVLSEDLRRRLEPFFGDDLLRRVRFVTLEGEPAERPPFFSQLLASGVSESVLAHFTDVTAITYQDVVVMPRARPDASRVALVFHELVHVAQFDELGTQAFLERYVDGWFSAGCRHDGIPLEIDAYVLQARFEADPSKQFDVRREVHAQLARDP
jgi:hypothetical protein